MNLIYLILLSVSVFSNDSFEFQIQSHLREGNVVEAQRKLESFKDHNATYWKLKGQLSMALKNSKEAIVSFEKSMKLKALDSTALMLSQVLLKDGAPLRVIYYLNKIKKPSIQKDLLLSQALWDTGKKKEAVSYLTATKKYKYLSYDLIERQKYYFLFRLGLVKKIFELSKNYLSNPKNSSEVALQVVSLLKEKNSYLTELYFDMVLTIRKKDSLLLRERGVFELEKKRGFLAADYFSRAAHLNPKYSFDAAAAYLSIGHHGQAFFFNTKVKNTSKKLVQLFTIYLDSKNYEKALSLKYELEKYNLLDQGKVSYALAYAAFKAKDHKAFNDCFSKVTSQVYITKILKLKEIMDSCKKEMGVQCAYS